MQSHCAIVFWAGTLDFDRGNEFAAIASTYELDELTRPNRINFKNIYY